MEQFKEITFGKLKTRTAFKFDAYGPTFVKCRGGFRPGCGGQLHSCQPNVKVLWIQPEYYIERPQVLTFQIKPIQP